MSTSWMGQFEVKPVADANAVAPVTTPPQEEQELLAGLRRRNSDAFTALVERHQGSLLRLARYFVSSPAVAEEVVQETWLGVLQGVDRFEGRCSLKTWIYRILMNRAKTRAEREGRTVPFSVAFEADGETFEPSVGPENFRGPADAYPGHWALPVREWNRTPEQMLMSQESRACILQAIQDLPANQRQVITLRDVEEWTSEEVCNALGISETNQRVLLHRARTRVRQAVEQYLQGGGAKSVVKTKRTDLPRTGGAGYRVSGRRAAGI